MAQKAVPQRSTLRLAISGFAGSGKTWTSLNVATHFLERIEERGYLHGNGRIAVLDTDRGRSTMYAKASEDDGYGFDFDYKVLNSFSPNDYVEALYNLDRENYSLIIVDQASPEWTGPGSTTERVNKIAKASRSENTFIAWPEVNPDHYQFVGFLMSLNSHLICNVMAKKKCVMDGTGVTPVGVRLIQREDFEREFDAVAMLNEKHDLKFIKARNHLIERKTFPLPGKDLGILLADWMLRGVGNPKSPECLLPEKYINEINQLWKELKYSESSLVASITKRGVESGKTEDLTITQAMEIIETLKSKKNGSRKMEVDKQTHINEIMEYKQELGISDQSIVNAVTKRGTRSGRLEDCPDHVVINILHSMRNKILIAHNTRTIESSLAAGPCPRPDSITKGREQEKGI